MFAWFKRRPTSTSPTRSDVAEVVPDDVPKHTCSGSQLSYRHETDSNHVKFTQLSFTCERCGKVCVERLPGDHYRYEFIRAHVDVRRKLAAAEAVDHAKVYETLEKLKVLGLDEQYDFLMDLTKRFPQ